MTRSDFWSRRKAAVEAEHREDLRALERDGAEAREADAADKSDAQILEELGLPDPDSLSQGDDFRVFLTETVPARIRTRALRRLWSSNPVLANIDGLVDYGEDFTDATCVVEGLQTAYQVGKGMAAHVQELARQAEEAQDPTEDGGADVLAASDDNATDKDTGQDTGQDTDHVYEAARDETGVAPDTGALLGENGAEEDPQYAQPPVSTRRMRFAFDVADTAT